MPGEVQSRDRRDVRRLEQEQGASKALDAAGAIFGQPWPQGAFPLRHGAASCRGPSARSQGSALDSQDTAAASRTLKGCVLSWLIREAPF